ncbi:MAG: type IV pilus modification protein PilV [Candidatus Thiodiazotropha sp.]
MRIRIKGPAYRHTRGMTLIEVLVAAVVIAVGLLGVAAMQVTALQGSSNALFRTQAIDLASALTDRINANRDALNAYTLADATVEDACDNPPDTICSMAPGGTAGDAANCTPEQMATYDVRDIACKIDNELPPNSTLAINCPGGCPALQHMTIEISWPTTELVNDIPVRERVRTDIIPGTPTSPPGS